MSGFVFEEDATYCTLTLTPDLSAMTWEQTRDAMDAAIAAAGQSRFSDVIVVLPALSQLSEGLLACLIRLSRALEHVKQHLILVAASAPLHDELLVTSPAGWKIMSSLESSLQFLRMGETGEIPMLRPSLPTPPLAAESSGVSDLNAASCDNPFPLEEHRWHCVITCHSTIGRLTWNAMETTVTETLSRYERAASANLMVDLSGVSFINSSLVTGLVRLWKATQVRGGLFSVVSPDPNVESVLKTSGLGRVWQIFDDHDDAAFALGVSQSERIKRRDRAILVTVSLCCAVSLLVLSILWLRQKPNNVPPAASGSQTGGTENSSPGAARQAAIGLNNGDVTASTGN